MASDQSLPQSAFRHSTSLRVSPLDGYEYPGLVVIDDALPAERFRALSAALMAADFRQWRIADHSMHGGAGSVPCDYLQADLDPADFAQADHFLTMRALARTHFSAVHLERVFINAFQFGDMNYIHSDHISGRPGVSLVMFANSYWEKDWGGELFFYTRDKEALCAVSPRPGRIVAFSNDVLHRPGIPNRIAPKPRVTLNVRFYR